MASRKAGPVRRLLLLVLIAVCAAQAQEPLTRVAFGSCNRHDLPQPLWEPIVAWRPQLWIWLGDNVYGDTEDMTVLAEKWRAQKEQPGYARLRTAARVLGTWDDHDYGVNNGDRLYPKRAESQALLLDFLDEPAASPRRMREGVYASETFGPPGRRVMVILLDVRYHREAPGAEATILGEAQWTWLEHALATSDAQVHLIASGTQILPAEHRYEKWADYPRDRARLLDLLRRLRPPGVVFLSGDRHIGEISRRREDGLDLLEITSSGLTHFFKKFPGEPNRLRFGAPLAALHFGTLEIDWSAATLEVALRDAEGKVFESAKLAFGARP